VVNIKRVKQLKKGIPVGGPVLYWMSRDQRVSDNWALAFAIEIAESMDKPVMVLFNLTEPFLGATWRQYDFMIKGLKKVEARLSELNIPFTVSIGQPGTTVPNFINTNKISHLIMDFDPIRIKREWQQIVTDKVSIPVYLVDAHNIVPCMLASDKEEYAASTFRPKIARLLPEFMDEFPPLIKQQHKLKFQRTHWDAITIALRTNRDVRPVEYLVPGEKGARVVLDKFLEERLGNYAAYRNDPNEKFVSGLSPYLHFGHISAQRIALEITTKIPRDQNTDSFLEELIIRKELADNFCFYNPAYDSTAAFKPWAIQSLTEHLDDPRDHIYSADEFEEARTHDPLWNAAQTQLLQTGNMHGYLRMYWAKKILEWSSNPEEALKVAIYLNDKYQLDGRDPGGYAGCAWSIGGVHDRAWGRRKIYGKIRYMNYAGCERKFDVNRYILSIKNIRKRD
jgi:deoxyribodipyrimidine photo-lyase